MASKKNDREKKYARRITKLAAEDPQKQELLFDIIKVMQEVAAAAAAASKFLKPMELKKATIQTFIDQGYDSLEVSKYYDAAKHQVIPFFNSGEKTVETDSHLDAIVQVAKNNLFKKVYNKDGDYVGESFDSGAANIIIKASKTKMDSLLKSQANVISAQNKVDTTEDKKDFQIEDADREQLERLIEGDLMEHPDLIEKLLQTEDNSKVIPAFYEVVENEESD